MGLSVIPIFAPATLDQLRVNNLVEYCLRTGLESRRGSDGFCDHRLISVYVTCVTTMR
jgi:hypothetical protein